MDSPAERRRQDPLPEFGPALRAARIRARWSLRQLARRAGTTAGYLSLLEHGHRAPSVVTIDMLTTALALTPHERNVFNRAGLAGVGHDHSRW
jgi:transcriptional regulator with XRE-family HTH domain